MIAEETYNSGGIDLLFTAVEVNSRHGVGVLLERFFAGKTRFVVVRSHQVYDGRVSFGYEDHWLPGDLSNVEQTQIELQRVLAGRKVGRILSIPYYPADFLHTLLAKQLTGAPMVCYLMDDQNQFKELVPDQLVSDVLKAADLRLGISSEMAAMYAESYGCEVHVMPPVIPQVASRVQNYASRRARKGQVVAMIGNVWTAGRFNQLRQLCRKSGVHLHWYGAGPDASWLKGTLEEWERDNIHCFGYLDEEDLLAALASYPAIVIPSGSCGEDDDNPAFSWLSLPSRVPFILASTDTPLIVLGSELSACAAFVVHNRVGLVCPFNEKSFRQVVLSFAEPESKRRFTGFQPLQSALVVPDAGERIWRALELRVAPLPELAPYFPPPHSERLVRMKSASERARNSRKKQESPTSAMTTAILSSAQRFHHVSSLGLLPQEWSLESAEITTFLQASMAAEIASLAGPGSRVLHVGDALPERVIQHLQHCQVWQVAPPTPAQLASGKWEDFCPKSTSSNAFPDRFDVLWTSNIGQIMGSLGGREASVLSMFDSLLVERGWHIHGLVVVKSARYTWVHPVYEEMRKLADVVARAPHPSDIMEVQPPYFMSDYAYSLYWEPHTRISSKEFGRAAWMRLLWQKPSLLWSLANRLSKRFLNRGLN